MTGLLPEPTMISNTPTEYDLDTLAYAHANLYFLYRIFRRLAGAKPAYRFHVSYNCTRFLLDSAHAAYRIMYIDVCMEHFSHIIHLFSEVTYSSESHVRIDTEGSMQVSDSKKSLLYCVKFTCHAKREGLP
jgi:hypothetical protein